MTFASLDSSWNRNNGGSKRKGIPMASTAKATLKGFLKQAQSCSAKAFLDKNREWLCADENQLSAQVKPIFEKLANNRLYPSPALLEICGIICTYLEDLENQKAAKAEKRQRFCAVIFDAETHKLVYELKEQDDGSLIHEPLEKSFPMPQDAYRWIDRKLVDNPACYGIIEDNGKPYDTVMRVDSIARVLKRPLGPSCRKTAGTIARLSFGMKVKEDRPQFSRG
jgi:hypothetical protein